MKKRLLKRIFTSIYALGLALAIVVGDDTSSVLHKNSDCLEFENSSEYVLPPIDVLIDDKPQDDF